MCVCVCFCFVRVDVEALEAALVKYVCMAERKCVYVCLCVLIGSIGGCTRQVRVCQRERAREREM